MADADNMKRVAKPNKDWYTLPKEYRPAIGTSSPLPRPKEDDKKTEKMKKDLLANPPKQKK